MTKRTVDIDDDLLQQAMAFMGTRTIKETVNDALADMAARPARRAEIAHWLSDPYRDLRELEEMKKRWRQEKYSL
jgi:Arc/MetJ family transcription regulator